MVLAFWCNTANAEPLLYGPVAIAGAHNAALGRHRSDSRLDKRQCATETMTSRSSPTTLASAPLVLLGDRLGLYKAMA